jgi:hypothetical protein
MTAGPLAGGLATSIGSLPHTDPDAAAAFALQAQPGLPAAPSLPRRSVHETMLGQAAWGVDGVDVAPDGSLVVAAPRALRPPAHLGDADCEGDAFAGLRAFAAAADAAGRTGPVKVQTTGPITFALALRAAGVPLGRAVDVARATTGRRAAAIVGAMARALPAVQVVAFVDEPGFAALRGADFPLSTDEAVDLLSASLAEIDGRAVTGVHCCGDTDWRAVLAAGPQILSLPVALSGGLNADDVDAFFLRGGMVAWGAVPTDGPLGDGPELLWRALASRWCDLVRSGCDGVALRTQSMVTPACGLARHGDDQAARVLDLTGRLAERLADEALGIRLNVGA